MVTYQGHRFDFCDKVGFSAVVEGESELERTVLIHWSPRTFPYMSPWLFCSGFLWPGLELLTKEGGWHLLCYWVFPLVWNFLVEINMRHKALHTVQASTQTSLSLIFQDCSFQTPMNQLNPLPLPKYSCILFFRPLFPLKCTLWRSTHSFPSPQCFTCKCISNTNILH